jgi:hypothetical protein
VEIGKPLRTITVEPLVLPVPRREPVEPAPRERPTPVRKREKQPA